MYADVFPRGMRDFKSLLSTEPLMCVLWNEHASPFEASMGLIRILLIVMIMLTMPHLQCGACDLLRRSRPCEHRFRSYPRRRSTIDNEELTRDPAGPGVLLAKDRRQKLHNQVPLSASRDVQGRPNAQPVI